MSDILDQIHRQARSERDVARVVFRSLEKQNIDPAGVSLEEMKRLVVAAHRARHASRTRSRGLCTAG